MLQEIGRENPLEIVMEKLENDTKNLMKTGEKFRKAIGKENLENGTNNLNETGKKILRR